MIDTLTPTELKARLDAGDELVLLDVREAEELEICALDGAVNIPLSELAQRRGELDPSKPTVCICHHGRRSAMGASILAEAGFERLVNLTGGIDAWADEVDPAMARY